MEAMKSEHPVIEMADSLATELVTNAWKKAWKKNTAPIPSCYTTRIEDASMPARSSETCWLRTKQELR
jgi:hypothetical protein